ncbi:DUF4047 domain-containing protein [Bacillus clarus]|uniref:DUF4047 domain-containing protein n=1 Tax=Bacillus clarus TaxID=2338372 RepID=A0A090YJS0_9BACI|nr:DUF4047 domain-containing protein [Bacillus clarus]KFM98714.1 hypothetical protein DJ93_3744 [Bacillus clarus]RFT66007.1 DUF4047 domain-containing protein [Bacillus clarus]
MLKTPHKLKKMLILPCMCSITFYLGSQVMTYTEAAFVHETKVQGTISTAVIFPKTIDTLMKEAEEHRQFIFHEYEEMNTKLVVDSVGGIEQAINVWKQGREKIVSERDALQKVYIALEDPYKQIKENLKSNNDESTQQLFSIVSEGLSTVKGICEDTDKQINLQKIDEKIRILEQSLQHEITKQANEVAKQKEVEEQQKLEQQKQLQEAERNKEKAEKELSQHNSAIIEQKKLQEIEQKKEKTHEELPTSSNATVEENKK